MYKVLRLLLKMAIFTTWCILNIFGLYKMFNYNTILGLIATLVLLIINIGVLDSVKKESGKKDEKENY